MACRMSASPLFDGVYLQPFMTVEAVRTSVGWIRAECERIGRDPATLRICLPLVSCPELPDAQARLQMHARMVTYLGQPGMGEVFARLNGWDAGEVIRQVRAHPMFADDPDRVDHRFHRADLVEVAKLVPDEWMYPTSLTGSVADCVRRVAAYRDLVDEVSTYGTSPAQNAALVQAWHEHTQKGARS
jgi:5,10-methylenetetrahydromethanopterin reductase